VLVYYIADKLPRARVFLKLLLAENRKKKRKADFIRFSFLLPIFSQ